MHKDEWNNCRETIKQGLLTNLDHYLNFSSKVYIQHETCNEQTDSCHDCGDKLVSTKVWDT